MYEELLIHQVYLKCYNLSYIFIVTLKKIISEKQMWVLLSKVYYVYDIGKFKT